jgi:hypothetical protein
MTLNGAELGHKRSTRKKHRKEEQEEEEMTFTPYKA